MPLFLLLAVMLAVLGMDWAEKPNASEERQFSQKVNLAMRQAADRLLDLVGDSTRTIPPVEKVSDSEYLLRLENNFGYDSLPGFLEEALAQFGIEEKYYVSVNDCLNNLLLIGYSQESMEQGDAPCLGRDQQAGCYNLSVIFPGRAKVQTSKAWLWWSGAALAIAAFLYFGFYKKLVHKELEAGAPQLNPTGNSSLLHFGSTDFDPANLFVVVGGIQQSLTFREAKLLNFFVQNQNQVLERDTILAAVWEDEGIIVGRSLDVFVSRLRKILQKDPSVKIANVHGVGYRLEV